MVKDIIFPQVGEFIPESVKQKFIAILKESKTNIKYVKLINIRESLTGLRFYIKTNSRFIIGEYNVLADSIICVDQKLNTKNFISSDVKRNVLVNNKSYFVKVE